MLVLTWSERYRSHKYHKPPELSGLGQIFTPAISRAALLQLSQDSVFSNTHSHFLYRGRIGLSHDLLDRRLLPEQPAEAVDLILPELGTCLQHREETPVLGNVSESFPSTTGLLTP